MFTRRILALAAALITAFTVATIAASATTAAPSSTIAASAPAHNTPQTPCGHYR